MFLQYLRGKLERLERMPNQSKMVTAEQRHRQYAEFLQAVDDSGVDVEDVENVSGQVAVKIRHLEQIFGYRALNGPGGRKIPLRQAKHTRVGQAYLGHYNRARRKHARAEANDLTLETHKGYLFDMNE